MFRSLTTRSFVVRSTHRFVETRGVAAEGPLTERRARDMPVSTGCRVMLLTWALLATWLAPASAIQIYDYNAGNTAKNERYTGFPAAPQYSTDASYIGLGIDYSGVGIGESGNIGSTRGSVLIAPQYFLTVKHRADEFIGPGVPAYQSISVVDRNNVVHTYPVNVASITPLHYTDGTGTHISDLVLGKLVSAITDPVAFYPIEDPNANVIGQQIQVLGQFTHSNDQTLSRGIPSVGYNNIDAIGSFNDLSFTSVGFIYDYTLGKANEAGVVGGDSGSPSFLANPGGLPALIGIHVGDDAVGGAPAPNTTFNSVDDYLPYYIPEINSLMAGSGFQVTVVPEPASASLLAVGVVGMTLLIRRRKALLARSAA